MFQKLDFYGRKLADGPSGAVPDKLEGAPRSGSVEIPNHFQDTIELELRSQLDIAKNDLSQVQRDIESKIKQEINKYPQFAQEESEVTLRLN